MALAGLVGVLTSPALTLFVALVTLAVLGIGAAQQLSDGVNTAATTDVPPSRVPMFLVASAFALVSLLLCIVNILT